MGTPEISLTTTDASNLYVVDYYGGSGGELMGELISESVSCVYTISKSKHEPSSVDSFKNFIVMPILNEYFCDILFHDNRSTDKIQGDTLVKNLMILHYLQKNNLLDDVKNKAHMISALETPITDNVLLRNHLPNRDFSLLQNRKHINVYADISEYHLMIPLMFLKQWAKPLTEYLQRPYKRKLKGWEWSCIENGYELDYTSFVDGVFVRTSKNTSENIDTYGINVNPVDFVYGRNNNWIKDIEEYIGGYINIDKLKKWQYSNLNMLYDLNLNLDSTKKDCRNACIQLK